MGMKEIDNEEIPVSEANVRVGRRFSAAQWEFLVRRMRYDEITFDRAAETIRCPGYIPFREFFQGVIEELDDGTVDARACRVCQRVFDVNTEEGIFGRPDVLENFVCEPCARALPAWNFYRDHMS